jgi:hypothetical protein
VPQTRTASLLRRFAGPRPLEAVIGTMPPQPEEPAEEPRLGDLLQNVPGLGRLHGAYRRATGCFFTVLFWLCSTIAARFPSRRTT